jgi:hypothetical protein
MKTAKVASVEDYKIVSSFQTLRKTLLEDKFADRLEKPLAYWAMPNDRRLPLAFLGRTIKDLLETPFEELSATPGIGQKKISCLMKLLSRATKDHPPAAPFGLNDLSEARLRAEKRRVDHTFDPAMVSEALWADWRETIARHALENQKLGRLAPTLQALPTVIWHTTLGFYVGLSIAEIRQLKTHGEKRVRVLLEIFHNVHETLGPSIPSGHLAVRLEPKFIEPVEDWLHSILMGSEAPAPEDVRKHFALPLLEQLKIDAGDPVHSLSQARLGIEADPISVRQQAKELGLTRARIYQLLEDCGKIMSVRWPEGQYLIAAVSAKLKAQAKADDDLRLFWSTVELFFPGNHRLADEDPDPATP